MHKSTVTFMTCDSCGAENWGASKRDVLEAGWKFHHARAGVEFVMCRDCESHYARLWRRRGREASADRAA
jgi:hypothetical protein